LPVPGPAPKTQSRSGWSSVIDMSYGGGGSGGPQPGFAPLVRTVT
jgi:hypothetical protein